MNINYQLPIRYGLISGITMCVVSMLTYFFYDTLFGSMVLQMLFGLLSFGLMLFFPIWGAVTYKREKGGNVGFVELLIVTFMICAIGMFFSSAMGYLIPNVIDAEYAQNIYNRVVKTTSESMEKLGSSDSDIEKALERIKLEDFKPTIFKTLKGYGISLIVGFVLSSLIAVFVARKNRDQAQLPQEPTA